MKQLGGWLLLCALLAVISDARAFELFCGRKNCFDVLGLNRSASQSQIKRAYRTLALDFHPDRNLGKSEKEKEEQAKKFMVIQTAYDAVKDNHSRTEYEDFLDHPHKYYLYYASGFAGEYAPEADVKVVLFALLLLFSGLHWANMMLNYSSLQRRVRASPQFKRQVSDLVNNRDAPNSDAADAILLEQITGNEKPHWKNSLPVVLSKMPFKFVSLILWAVHWLVVYRLLKRDYNRADQEYLTIRELEMSSRQWSLIPTHEQDELVEQKLWIKKNKDEFLRSRRVDMNRKGGRKKPRARKSQPIIDDSFVE